MENYINPLLRRISSSRHLKFDPPTSIAESFCPIEINHFPPSSLHALALFQTHSWFTATHSSYSSHRYNPTWKFQVALFCKALAIVASTHTCTFTTNSPVRNLGVIFYLNLIFFYHITHLSRSCFISFISVSRAHNRHSIHDFWHTGCMRVLISWYHTN